MIISNKAASEKRKDFRKALSHNRLLCFPGAFAPLIALLVEQHDFDGIYVSGAAISNEMGLPDVSLTNQAEVSRRAHQISRVVDLPTIVAADTGFGEPMNTARTISILEELGLTGCHIEDQLNPKRCGHLDHKILVERDEMCLKVRAASDAKKDSNFTLIARTDARGPEGLTMAIERAKAYVDSGADMIFPEALESESEFEEFRNSINVPLLANMTEFGKTPLLNVVELEALGFNLVIYPMSLMRLSLKSVETGLKKLKKNGSQKQLTSEMFSRNRLYEVLQYENYNQFDQQVHNFILPDEN